MKSNCAARESCRLQIWMLWYREQFYVYRELVPRTNAPGICTENIYERALGGLYSSSLVGVQIDLVWVNQVYREQRGTPQCTYCKFCVWHLGNSTVTELQIRDSGLLFNHFVLYSFDLRQFEYFYLGAEVPMPSLETQNLSEFSLVLETSGAYVSR